MNVSWTAVFALVGSLIGALIPLPKRAEGVRLGFFAGILALVVIESLRRRAQAADRRLVPLMSNQVANEPANPTAERAERLRRASRLLDKSSPDPAAAQWRRFGQLARSRAAGVKSAA
jgi:hypothetical protein